MGDGATGKGLGLKLSSLTSFYDSFVSAFARVCPRLNTEK